MKFVMDDDEQQPFEGRDMSPKKVKESQKMGEPFKKSSFSSFWNESPVSLIFLFWM